jgi:hypothetical protein
MWPQFEFIQASVKQARPKAFFRTPYLKYRMSNERNRAANTLFGWWYSTFC